MHSFKRFAVSVLALVILIFAARQTAHAATCTLNGSGDWNNAGIWSCGHVPTNSDAVVIAAPHSVVVNVDTANVSNVEIDAGGTLSLTSAFTLAAQGAFHVKGTLNMAAGTITMGSGNNTFDVQNGGSANLTGGTLNIGGRLALQSGSTTTIGGAAINIDPQQTNSLAGGSHSFEAVGGANVTFSSGVVTIVDPNASTGDGHAIQIVSGSGSKDLSGGTFALGDGASTSGGSTEGFDVNCGALTLGNLIVNNPSGTNRFVSLVTNSCILDGDLNIIAGEFQQNGKNLTVVKNWNNAGTFTAGTSGVVVFNGTSAQTLSKSGAGATETFCNLTIASSAALNTGDDMVAVSGGGSCGTLTQSGKLIRTMPAQTITNGGGAVTFTDSRNVNTAIVTQTGGSDMGATTVTVTSNAGAPACGNRVFKDATILRWYDIAPTNVSGVTATVRLYYRTTNPDETSGITAADVRIYHCDGAYWTELGGTPGSDGAGQYVELTGVTTFSPFALATTNAPTSIVLRSFNAKLMPKNKVRVKWATDGELDVLGFNLYRQTVGKKQWIKLNGAEPIAPQHAGLPDGARYKWMDKQVKSGKTYRYKLEVLRANGLSEWSEIVKVGAP